MCTCIELKNKDFYFGRNLDLEYRFGEKVVITPRDYGFKLRSEPDFRTRYAMIGMAAVAGDYPLYAEAANEKGLPTEALDYLEQVRAHARGTLTDVLPKVTTTNQSELRDAIRHTGRRASEGRICQPVCAA